MLAEFLVTGLLPSLMAQQGAYDDDRLYLLQHFGHLALALLLKTLVRGHIDRDSGLPHFGRLALALPLKVQGHSDWWHSILLRFGYLALALPLKALMAGHDDCQLLVLVSGHLALGLSRKALVRGHEHPRLFVLLIAEQLTSRQALEGLNWAFDPGAQGVLLQTQLLALRLAMTALMCLQYDYCLSVRLQAGLMAIDRSPKGSFQADAV